MKQGNQDKDFSTGLQMVLTRSLVSSAAQAKKNIGTIIIQKTPSTFIFIYFYCCFRNEQEMYAKQISAIHKVSNTTFSMNEGFQ